jgi:hypothetical protein
MEGGLKIFDALTDILPSALDHSLQEGETLLFLHWFPKEENVGH